MTKIDSENTPPAADQSGAEGPESSPAGILRWLPHLPRWVAFLRGLRWISLRAVVVLGGFVFLLLMITGAAGWYTSRPEFCRSCHIMEPYFVSWEQSSHKDVACVKCHFAPGFGEKVWGKTLGLVQLAKYVTQTEGPRPAAEIPDASCLRSGCHETRLLSGRVDFQGVPFDHKPHLEELRRGKRLRCTSCHSQIVQGRHMTVTTSTCFLCHFKGGIFNEGVGACTRCHQIPSEEFDLGGGVTFKHKRLPHEKGIGCFNCHGDLIRGSGEVPRERCQVCHNREEDLKRIGDAEFMHQNHVSDHKIDCLDCHLGIQHSLDREKVAHAAADCAVCHPDHHREQVNMLRGLGGETIPDQTGGMRASRVECRSCHRIREISPTGTVLWRASADVCIACHDALDREILHAYFQELEASLSDIRRSISWARTALESADVSEGRAEEIRARLEKYQHDLDFLAVANGVHNSHYAGTLTRALVDGLSELCRELDTTGPRVTLPDTPEGFR